MHAGRIDNKVGRPQRCIGVTAIVAPSTVRMLGRYSGNDYGRQ
jgi:hypothetical protein